MPKEKLGGNGKEILKFIMMARVVMSVPSPRIRIVKSAEFFLRLAVFRPSQYRTFQEYEALVFSSSFEQSKA